MCRKGKTYQAEKSAIATAATTRFILKDVVVTIVVKLDDEKQ